MARIDLDAARAKREGETHVVGFGGGEFTLPPELPFAIAQFATDGDLAGMIRVMLGDEQYAAFMELRPSLNDVMAMIEQAMALYGFDDMGESLASVNSSKNTSSPSRPTSLATTASSLRTPVSATR